MRDDNDSAIWRGNERRKKREKRDRETEIMFRDYINVVSYYYNARERHSKGILHYFLVYNYKRKRYGIQLEFLFKFYILQFSIEL